jgi:hypothetical protein
LPVATAARLAVTDGRVVPEAAVDVRRVAFLAHEWGHLAAAEDYGKTVTQRRGRTSAIASEVKADMDALLMLAQSGHHLAGDAATVLVIDRIAREAWLRRSHSQVDSVAARHLLLLLTRSGALALADDGLHLDLAAAAATLDAESAAISTVLSDRPETAAGHFANVGWQVEGRRWSVAQPPATWIRLRSAARMAGVVAQPQASD